MGHIPKVQRSNEFDFIYIGLNPKDLDIRIEKRLYKRLPKIITEVRKLRKGGLTWKRLRELGLEYRYVGAYVKGEMSRNQMTSELLREIKKYAKRQMTWFKRNKKIKWFAGDEGIGHESLLVSKARYPASRRRAPAFDSL